MKWLLPTALLAALAVVFLRAMPQGAASAGEGGNAWDDAEPIPTDDQSQLPTTFEAITVSLSPSTYTPAAVSVDQAQANRRAFLDMLAYSEGTNGPDGYRTMFGGQLAPDLADHPHVFFDFVDKAGRRLSTSAAGRYQFLWRTWDALRNQLSLPDFGPESQDSAALELVRQRGALNDVDAGRFADAVRKCAPIWASLPGAGYDQPERKLSQLVAAYTAAGGSMEA